MPRVAIYAHKSSESDDKQAKSIDEQLAWARLICAELGVLDPLVFQEARSARRPGRAEFSRLIAAVWRGEIDTIVTWKADRLARNPSDSGNVQQALMEGKVVVVTSDRRYSEVDDQFMLNIEFGFSTKYSQDL
jgi:site-specific DNA recombinase